MAFNVMHLINCNLADINETLQCLIIRMTKFIAQIYNWKQDFLEVYNATKTEQRNIARGRVTVHMIERSIV